MCTVYTISTAQDGKVHLLETYLSSPRHSVSDFATDFGFDYGRYCPCIATALAGTDTPVFDGLDEVAVE